MKIKPVHIVVDGPCPNKCPFCISKMNSLNNVLSVDDVNEKDVLKRMMFARQNGFNVLCLTGTGEPLCRDSLATTTNLLLLNNQLKEEMRFNWVEVQTSGACSDGRVVDELMRLKVSVVGISVADPFDDANNAEIMKAPEKNQFELSGLCRSLKGKCITRLIINLTENVFAEKKPSHLLKRAEELGIDQITIRKLLYDRSSDSYHNKWVRENAQCNDIFADWQEFVQENGDPIFICSNGNIAYDINGFTIMLDDPGSRAVPDKAEREIGTLIIRENGRCYTRWDYEGSVLF